MKKFYETYKDNEIVTPLVTQISWTNHLLIMSGCKTDEEREFYIRLCIKENYSKRQLERRWSACLVSLLDCLLDEEERAPLIETLTVAYFCSILQVSYN